ncbi:MAG: GDP-mannose 4,6-dehydratase [Candidatus Omnitrophica bacterium]|nr:GDP-mannose 4,6-dehydratase [Candidatus Omnitrophota bacterium]
MQTCLITGISGFVGSHLAEHILSEHPDWKVVGTIRWRSRHDNIEHLEDRVQLYECDLRDPSAVERVVKETLPERIFGLAAQSHVPTSWIAPKETLDNNVISQLNLMEAMRRADYPIRFLVCGSSEEYGLVHEEETPVKETNPLRPLSPYGVSKVTQDLLGFQYHRSYGLHIVRTRAFNHTGVRRPAEFICGKVVKQALEIKQGKRERYSLGNLDAKRDFTDVRDMVRAYWLALEKAEPGEVYNICSGKTVTIREVVDMVSGIAGVSNEVETDPQAMRPSDVPILLGDCSRFKLATGWELRYTLRETLEWMWQWHTASAK